MPKVLSKAKIAIETVKELASGIRKTLSEPDKAEMDKQAQAWRKIVTKGIFFFMNHKEDILKEFEEVRRKCKHVRTRERCILCPLSIGGKCRLDKWIDAWEEFDQVLPENPNKEPEKHEPKQ